MLLWGCEKGLDWTEQTKILAYFPWLAMAYWDDRGVPVVGKARLNNGHGHIPAYLGMGVSCGEVATYGHLLALKLRCFQLLLSSCVRVDTACFTLKIAYWSSSAKNDGLQDIFAR